MALSLEAGDLLPFGLLTLALGSLWLPERARPGLWWPLFLALASVGAIWGDLLTVWGVASLLLLALGCRELFGARTPTPRRIAGGLVTLALATALLLHLAPGFANPKVIDGVVLKPGALPYSKYLNFDKGAAGLLLIAFAGQRIRRAREWRLTLARTAPVVMATLVAVLLPSLALGFVRFDPTPVPFPILVLWAWTNLFFTCVAEEAVFRGVVQLGLERALGRVRHGRAGALAIASIVFGLSHLAGGWRYALLSAIAGAGYGYAMQRSGRLEAAILTHFAVNLVHVLAFTYPALA